MKKLLVSATLFLLCAFRAPSQTQTTTISIVAQASLGTVTPTPSHFYQNVSAPISLASSTNGFNSSCTLLAGTTSIPVTYSATTNTLTGTIPSTALSGAVGSTVTLTITCTAIPLTMNSPVALPNAVKGQAYSASLQTVTGLSGGVPPYTWNLDPTTPLPPGLSLSSSGAVSGVASGTGSFSFLFTVQDSSGLALRHRRNQWTQAWASRISLLRQSLSGG